jgi:hypothetical protein
MTERRRRNRTGERALVGYFHANRGEWLTAEDAAAKIGIDVGRAARYLSALSGQGVVKRVSVYYVPPLDETQPVPAASVQALCTVSAPAPEQYGQPPATGPIDRAFPLQLLTP